ncbi:MAG: phosphonate ABC transporter, permease protein PhnE [Nitrospinota bacterium]|nr:phosphonate ABC transporter, permease protein PhnE [Nitrospinota bacterium]MDP6620456.1 phosphonate ABC transporter, permease protein PhnE [Nitrospinota bacterium]
MSRGPALSAAIPERPGVSWKAWGSGLLLLAVLAWSYSGTEANFRELIGEEGRSQMWKFVSGLWPPETSLKFLGGAARAAVQTLAISIMGTALSVIIASVLTAFASDNLMVRGVLFERAGAGTAAGRLRYTGYWAARTAMAVLRSVPEIVLAIIFIFAVGLGPFAGVLALGVHNGGVLGKLYSETLENVDPRPIEALQATGAGRFSIFLYGLLPQAFPQLLAYTLYRWEVNIRTATILGIIGGGGIGLKIHIALSLFLQNQLLVLIAVIFVLVTAVDFLSSYLRRRLT